MIERFAVRIYDPNGVIAPHKEFEIQPGITRYLLFTHRDDALMIFSTCLFYI